MASLTGIIFDHSTILLPLSRRQSLNDIRALFELLKNHGIKIIVFSTNQIELDSQLRERNLPDVDLFLTRDDVGVNKGSPKWVTQACDHLGLHTHQTAYVGDDQRDWRGATHVPSLYLHAKWVTNVPEGVTAIAIERPLNIWRFLTHFLLPPPRWEYKLDLEEEGLHIRSLLNANVVLAATEPPSFTLLDVLKKEIKVKVDRQPAEDLLILHALTSLYLEGFVSPYSVFTIYPSSTPGNVNPILESVLKYATRLFHGYFKNDLLVRGIQSIDTSQERADANRERRRARVTFADQTNSLYVNPDYRRTLQNRQVFVFDDFTSSGMSLEWARHLLLRAGASKVTLLTLGKYSRSHTHTLFTTTNPNQISPWARRTYNTESLFSSRRVDMEHDINAQELVKRSFQYWKDGLPLPI